MWSWLSKLDPNTVLGVLTLVSTVATWLYHKAKGDQTSSFDDVLRGIGKQVINILLSDSTITALTEPAYVKGKALDLLWTLATRAGVPRNTITEALASALVEHVVGDTLAELRARVALPNQLDELASKAADVLKLFPPKTQKPQELPIVESPK